MIIQDNLILNRAEPDGLGGVQFLYKVNDYGVTAISKPQEEITHIHWEVDVIRPSDFMSIIHSPFSSNKGPASMA